MGVPPLSLSLTPREMCINDIWPSFSLSFGFLTVCPNVAGAAAAVPARWRRCRSCSWRCSRRWRSSSVSFIFINLTYFRVKLRRSGSDATPAQSPRLFLSHSSPFLSPSPTPLTGPAAAVARQCAALFWIPVASSHSRGHSHSRAPFAATSPLSTPSPSPCHSRCRSQAGS